MSSTLFQPLQVGALKLNNRIIMAPLTRSRATGADERTPNDLMKEYYVQRASAGLILTEATSVTPMGVGYARTPGIWSEEQVASWKKITTAVHEAGGKIALQLWHVGRVSHPIFLNGELPVAPSAIAPKGHISLVRPITEFVVPRELKLEEIPGSLRPTGRAPRTRSGRASTRSKFMAPMDIYWISFYKTSVISERIITGARLKIARD